MKDNYVLVTKEELKKLRDNNKKFQDEIKTDKDEIKKVGSISKFSEEIISEIKKENQIERELIKKELAEIKELNKITIDNVLSKSSVVEKNLIGLTDTLKELVSELRVSFEKEDEKNLFKELMAENTDSIKEIISTFLESQKLKDIENSDNKNEFLKKILVIASNLKDVEDFMNNLKLLLSYLSPNAINLKSKEKVKEEEIKT